MKAGRPKYHVKAKWITVYGAGGSLMYFELDKKGNLNRKNNVPFYVPHHVDIIKPNQQINDFNDNNSDKINKNDENIEEVIDNAEQFDMEKTTELPDKWNNQSFGDEFDGEEFFIGEDDPYGGYESYDFIE
ncbi:hypothetical protein TRFO_03190 [Tritrichomonas foetus]|uniref:Uncharacterized protein n=1 Tax=Tritrichomonas foetus TaxID=1144522 RepID=A0A1J4KX67_9EUKA|nr:hypothetical protein TRFO_03190 [Tritrichomonas foetus]|eukprot:OHT14149.1 hypothetical protein TRFO_03190 [Tritrichomonas foetus]